MQFFWGDSDSPNPSVGFSARTERRARPRARDIGNDRKGSGYIKRAGGTGPPAGFETDFPA